MCSPSRNTHPVEEYFGFFAKASDKLWAHLQQQRCWAREGDARDAKRVSEKQKSSASHTTRRSIQEMNWDAHNFLRPCTFSGATLHP